ncbi:esterase-like activity of phytase family protein [Parvularcula marina]|uniref:Phytase-like domain-containing protein n=1 Tax=Parvularcula marina TaxID=2292771 RepID=A0A371RFK9_9PROT|nr:esterase-like activity of phytase family protein [Parvularcula marina]RFB04238.1 hypothetical protein DX908_02425 [Parvularcula marina]
MSPFLALLLAAQPTVIDVVANPFPNDLSGRLGCTQFESGISLEGEPVIGGLSAMRIDGDQITLIGDDALAYSGEVIRNEDGFIRGLKDLSRLPLTNKKGEHLAKSRGDSEGLALYGSGAIVSLERKHRISRFRITDKGWTEDFPLYEETSKRLKPNQGFEALTELKDGRLLAISEGKDEDGLAHVVLLTREGDRWEAVETSYRPGADFNVTDVSVDPKTGDLFVLERAFSRMRGPRARLARVAAPDLYEGAVMEGDEMVRLSALNGVDNMEGLQMERRADGALLAQMISDDNYNRLQQTVVMGFRIDEARCSASAIARNAARARSEAVPQGAVEADKDH